jgi:hypothetical protein
MSRTIAGQRQRATPDSDHAQRSFSLRFFRQADEFPVRKGGQAFGCKIGEPELGPEDVPQAYPAVPNLDAESGIRRIGEFPRWQCVAEDR